MMLEKFMKPVIRMILLLALLPSLISCQGNFLAKGPVVIPKKQMIPLSDGIQEGIWRTKDLHILYRFQKTQPDLVSFSGEIVFEPWLEIGFSRMDRFQLDVFFLNTGGQVLGSQPVYLIANAEIDVELNRFNRRLTLPSGTTAVSFGYDAKVINAGNDDGMDSYDFWYP
jgi:hypothetical protein